MTDHPERIKISLVGIGSETLINDLENAQIEYFRVRPREGAIIASGEFVEIASAVIISAGIVLANWVRARSSRRVSLTFEDNTIRHIEAQNAKELESLLPVARQVMAIETEKPEKSSDTPAPPTQ